MERAASGAAAAVELGGRIRWIAATTVGLGFVGFGLHFPGSPGFGSGIDTWQVALGMVGAIQGAISGVIVGLVQWLGLRPVRGGPWLLVAAMAVGIGFTHALGDGAPASLGRAPFALASGLVLTGALALALAEYRPIVLAASVVGWTGGLLVAYAVTGALGLPLTQDPIGWGTEHAVVGVVTGLAWGGLTAAVGFPTGGAVALSRALRREG